MTSEADVDGASATGGEGEGRTSRRAGYLHEIQFVLVASLVLVCAATGIAAWHLHPASSGFPAIPQDLRIVTSGPNFNMTQTLTPTADGGATLQVDEPLEDAAGKRSLLDTGGYSIENAPGYTAESAGGLGPMVKLDGSAIPNESWSYLVLNPGPARLCRSAPVFGEDVTNTYKAGKVELPWYAKPVSAFVVAVTFHLADEDLPVPVICLHWSSGSPVAANGAYLSARFPPVHGIAVDAGQGTSQPDGGGDLATGTVTRVLTLTDATTSDFNVQSDPLATLSYQRSWIWVNHGLPQTLQLAAINSSDLQRENNNAFYAGILFGIAGGALVALIAELVRPFNRRKPADRLNLHATTTR